VAYSQDYAVGFKQGLADYVERGGSGDAPPVPPPHYWKTRFQTPQGYHAMEDWFAGFRHGAAVAREGGYRNFIVIPSSNMVPALSYPPAHPDTTLMYFKPATVPQSPLPPQEP
jgi:hypothetical protein